MRKTGTVDGTDRYSWVGPLSLYKGCDRAWTIDGTPHYAGENPGVVTDGYCFLPWIASVYDMKMPSSFVQKSTCSKYQYQYVYFMK